MHGGAAYCSRNEFVELLLGSDGLMAELPAQTSPLSNQVSISAGLAVPSFHLESIPTEQALTISIG